MFASSGSLSKIISMFPSAIVIEIEIFEYLVIFVRMNNFESSRMEKKYFCRWKMEKLCGNGEVLEVNGSYVSGWSYGGC